MKANHSGKAKHDRLDAQKIAVLLRGGLLSRAYAYPATMRATCDSLQRRLHLTRKRAELLAHVQHTHSQSNLPEIGKKLAYKANRASVAAWLRHAMRQVTRANFPPSWQAGEIGPRSHDSRYFRKRFLMRLDEATRQRLEELSGHFDKPVAEVIRQLVAQARIEAFPQSWHLAVNERRQREARSDA